MRTEGRSDVVRAVVIDDSALFRESVRGLFAQTMRLELVGSAASGAEGIRLIEQVGPDLVLVDLMMPEMNGLETIRRIRRQDGLPRVLLMSMHCGTGFAHAALDAGADAFVHKQDLYHELERLVSVWFGAAETGKL